MYRCTICNYESNFSANYKRHLLTNKHQHQQYINNKVSTIEMNQNEPVHFSTGQEFYSKPKFICKYCKTEYKRKAYLNRHLPKCSN